MITDIDVAGDSLSTGGDFDSTQADPGSWTEFLGRDVKQVGGWHKDGATTVEISQNIMPHEAQVLVILAGTNDLRLNVPVGATLKDYELIVDKAHVRRVLILAIPPFGPSPKSSEDLNRRIRDLAQAERWYFLDPWQSYRALGGGWIPGSSSDGYHPNIAIYRSVGRSVTAEVNKIHLVNASHVAA